MTTKEKVLQFLEENRDNYISGSEIAQALNCSRNAVWKAIEDLRKSGMNITAITKKGYKLLKSDNTLSATGIKIYLNEKVDCDNIYVYDCVDSTNLTAKKLAIEGKPTGTTVIANSQTNGKGRMGRKFYSPENTGLYMSIIIKPQNMPIDKILMITSSAAVCVCRAIEKVSDVSPQIKWVNDVYLNEKKVCGILTECITNVDTMSIDSLIVGIGVNVSTAMDEFPENIQNTATSIANNSTQIVRNQLAGYIINEMLDSINHLDDGTIIDEYKKRSFVIGKKVNIIHDYAKMTVDFSGTAIDIDNSGSLVVQKDNGEIIKLNTGEISIRIAD